MMNSTPMPPRLQKAKTAALAGAVMATTAALTIGLTSPIPDAVGGRSDTTTFEALPVQERATELLAAIGLYPVGPGAQIARLIGAGSPEGALNTLGVLAGLLPGDVGNTITAVTDALQGLLGALDGLGLLPDIRVPRPGPAGTVDAVASLDDTGANIPQSAAVVTLVSLLKTLQANIPLVPETNDVVTLPGDNPADTLANLAIILKNVPLNAPGTSLEVALLPDLPGEAGAAISDLLSLEGFLTSATKLAIIPTWGLGGTNAALASPELMKMTDTIVLIVALRNTSRPGGGIVALLNPISSLFGLPLANADGTGETTSDVTDFSVDLGPLGEIDLAKITTTTYTGNLTVWDITAAYDLLSDAPSTIWNPLAWANSGVGFMMPTYLIPANVTDFAEGIDALLGGDILGGLEDLLGALSAEDGAKIHFQKGLDGNWYITYDSGHLPLLEPFQVIPRTLSYFPGFKIDTPVSSSFEDVLTQLVATGYQDVNMEMDNSTGVATFERAFDMAGVQAKFWQSPITLTQSLELPQTVMNSVIDGLDANLLNPQDQRLELFGNTALGDAIYRNPLSLGAAQVARDLLNQIRGALNPLMNQAQGLAAPVTQQLDALVQQVNGLIDDGLAGLGTVAPDLYQPMMDVNRFFNNLPPANWDNGIPGALEDSGLTTLSGSQTFSAPAGAQAKVAGDSNPTLKISDLAPQNDLLSDVKLGGNAKDIAKALKEQSDNARADLKAGLSNAQKQGEKAVKKVGDAVKDVGDSVQKVGQDVKKAVDKAGTDVKKAVSPKADKPAA